MHYACTITSDERMCSASELFIDENDENAAKSGWRIMSCLQAASFLKSSWLPLDGVGGCRPGGHPGFLEMKK